MEMLGRVGIAVKVYGKLGFIREIKFPPNIKGNKPEQVCFNFFHSPLTCDPITFGAQMANKHIQ